jgi:hypothetical protein
MKESSLDFCPVPLEQQPVNEYEHLKDSWLFNWATLDNSAYRRKLAWVGFWGWLLAAPIAAASFPPRKLPWLFLLSAVLGASFLVGLVLLRIYLGWCYIRDRLKSDRVFYEESGWYDGQIWHKPPEILARDRLIASYQVQPILQRLQGTTLILGIIVVNGGLLWLYLNQLTND